MLGGALLGAASLPIWLTGVVDDPVLGHRAVSATGRTAVPAAAGLGLVALAGAVVAAISGRVVQALAGALVLAAGAGSGALIVRVLTDPAGALTGAAAETLARAGDSPVSQVSVAVWPWLALVGATTAAIAGLLVLLLGRSWRRAGARYANPARSGASGASGTARLAGRRQPPAETGRTRDDATSRRARSEAVDDWDSLTRGEDPTT